MESSGAKRSHGLRSARQPEAASDSAHLAFRMRRAPAREVGADSGGSSAAPVSARSVSLRENGSFDWRPVWVRRQLAARHKYGARAKYRKRHINSGRRGFRGP